MTNSYERGFQNELTFLNLVHRYGHIRQTDIGRAIWPDSTRPTVKSLVGRLSSRLLESRQIVRTANPMGTYSFLLTSIGANRLGLALEDEVRSGRNITSVFGNQFFHRTLGTRYLIEKEIVGMTCHGEYSIFRGLSGLNRDHFTKKFKKVPDGLVFVPGPTRGQDPDVTLVDWVEVEGFYKPRAERNKILALTSKFGTWLDQDRKLLLDRIVIVYSVLNSHQSSMLKGIAKFIQDHDIKNPEVLSAIVLAECDVRLPFSWRGYSEKTWLEMREVLPSLTEADPAGEA